MQKDPYIILGLAKGASKEDVERQYATLKEKYSKERFVEGEVGMNAARSLSEVEQAYKDCLEDIKSSEMASEYGTIYVDIENIIKSGEYDKAQKKLDDIDLRDAEWHYYQSMIYFKKGWHSESKAQLEICIALDPTNSKYNTALNKMNDYLKNEKPFNEEQAKQSKQQRAGYSDKPVASQYGSANACLDTCCTMMCCDSCCECMGGDLIPCC